MNKKLKRMLGAVLAFSALICALLVLNAVSVFAADGDATTYSLDFSYTVKALTYAKVGDTAGTADDWGVKFVANTYSSGNGAKFDKFGIDLSVSGNSKSITPKGGSTPYWIAVNASVGDYISITSKSTYRWDLIGPYTADETASTVGSLTLSSDKFICSVTPTAATTSTQFGKQIQESGVYFIVNGDSSSNYVTAVTVTEGTLAASTTISGTVTNNSSYVPTLKIDNNIIASENSYGGFSITAVPDTYEVVCDNDLVDVVIKDSSDNTITSIDNTSDVTGLTITLTDKAVTTLSGTVDTNLTSSGKIAITSASGGFSGNVEISGGSYSITVPQSDTYTLSLDSNDGYIASQYTIKTNSITIGTESAAALNLEGEKITSWDFSSLPATTMQSTTGTYKGIYVDASSGKFDAQPSNDRVQFNANTKAYVPISAGEKVSITTSNGKCTVTEYSDYALITTATDDYIKSIEIVTDTPALTLSAGTNALTAAVSDVSEENEIQSIVVRKASETDGTAITKIKEDGGSYSFTAQFLSSRNEAVNGEIDLVYASGDSTETAVYGFTLAADGTVTVTAGI